uniref:DUF4097 family beta strand repeat-containing protein n=1 Tax=Ningiella ruwaisensis TaxID=2364274 RepID=UPI001F4F2B2B|nr:DUF4097 family beta strand repeat-containing protein [Ningiella ruwaisensis]
MNRSHMNVFTKIMTLTLLLALSLAALAGQTVNQSLDAEPDGIVEIEHMSGKAKIVGWEQNQVKVEGELGDDTKEFIFRRKGASIELNVEVERNDGWFWNNDGNIDGDDLTIYVPINSRVEYDATNASLQIQNINGSVSAELVNGDIDANNLRGAIKLETVNGDIDAKQVSGTLDIETVNGDVEVMHEGDEEVQLEAVNGDLKLTSSAKDVSVETVNGSIDFNLKQVRFVDAETVNGDILISMDLLSGAVVKAESVGGRIRLALPSDVEAKFDIEVHAGGSIRNDLTADEPQKAEYGPRKWLSFTTGNPNATVDINTVNGSVQLKRQ